MPLNLTTLVPLKAQYILPIGLFFFLREWFRILLVII